VKKKNQVPTFFIRLLHSVHFREILSGYFLFSRFDWSIFVTQLVAKHMKEIIIIKNAILVNLIKRHGSFYGKTRIAQRNAPTNHR
jgi:hypothetical protein